MFNARRLACAVIALVMIGAAPAHAASDARAMSASALPPFYDVPDPLPPGQPGDIIKSEVIASTVVQGTMYRVMYHSRSIMGDDIAVTGLIAVPSSAPPADGYPVVTWAHGTTGIADVCAPSLSPDSYGSIANVLLSHGYVVTGTDYEGLGTPGRHPYVVGESEARSTLDIVRAARNLQAVHASDRYVVWGHSQGGHAAMFALHIAADWAPELHQLGVVAGAPPSQLFAIYQALYNSPFRYYLLMAAAGWNAAYGDEAAPLDAVLTQEGLDTVHVVDEGCTDYIAAQTAGIPTGDLVKADPNTVPKWNKLLHDNDPGTFTSASSVPLLIIQGGNDEQIPVVSTALLFDQLCKVDQVEQRWIYPGQSHTGVIGPSLQDMLNWIGDRFAGVPAPSVVPTGQTDVQTQSCPAPEGGPTTTTTPSATTTPASSAPDVARTATPVEATPTLTG